MPATGDKGRTDQYTIPDSKINEVLEIISENVGPNWPEMGKYLGLENSELISLKHNHKETSPTDACWDMLCKWRMGDTSKVIMIRDLHEALKQCRLHRVSDLVSKLLESSKSTDDILSPHGDREEKMLEAMYVIVDGASSHWRALARHLKHTEKDIIALQHQFGPRTREKCMHTLYKWRYRVPLQEYKLSNLIMALRSCGLAKIAENVKEIGNGEVAKKKHRKLREDEIGIHVEIEQVNVENYTPTPVTGNTPIPGARNTDPTPRPKNILPKHLLQEYTMNKLFFHFLDCLEMQESQGTHPLVDWLATQSGCYVTEVSRMRHFISVRCPSKGSMESLRQCVQNGEISEVLQRTLITETIQRELGLARASIKATEY